MLSRIDIPGVVLGGELGHGAYSIVHRAHFYGAACAVKLPRSKGRWTRWVYREAVALARVRHPALPKVLAVGEAGDVPYIVMELVEGQTLADRIAQGPLEQDELFDLIVHLTDALAAVHAVGLVHRDVKPRNVIIDASGAVRLVDFGFAIPMDKSPGDAAGTPGFAAPEQLRMPARVDHRADLFALGRIILTCEVEGEESIPSSLAEIARALTAENPEDRYASARALALELRNVQAGGSVLGPAAYPVLRDVPPLVGREVERRRLLNGWAKLESQGAGSIAVLSGPRGSGKSHLLESTIEEVRRSGGLVLKARCLEGSAPLAVLRVILESLERANAIPALREAATGELATLAAMIAPTLAVSLGTPKELSDLTADGFAEGATEIFVRLSKHVRRLMLVVDDLQWIDPPSRDVLARLAARMPEASAFLVVAVRDVPHAADSITAVVPLARVTAIELAPLRDRKIEALVAAYLSDPTLNPEIATRVAALSDGTPLGILEVLGAFLDAGAVRPRAGTWIFEEAYVEHVSLPQGALALAGRRIGELPPATRRVVEWAAILGSTFDEQPLARVVGVPRSDLAYALDDAHRSGLVESVGPNRHRFVHDSLREMLVATLTEPARRTHHQHVAETLDGSGPTSIEAVCAIALHYERGVEDAKPERRLHASLRAANAVLELFDNERAIHFFELARAAAKRCGVKLDASFHLSLGQAQYRVGALDESLASFELALAATDDAHDRAIAFQRIAWVHQTRGEADPAWNALERAFGELHASLPRESVGSALRTVATIASRALHRDLSPSEASRPLRERELLCELHIQNSRLGAEHFKPARFGQSALAVGRLVSALPPSHSAVRGHAWNGLLLSIVGRRDAGAAELSRAEQMAVELGDPFGRAYSIQLGVVASAWAGRPDECIRQMEELFSQHAHWLELSEYCELAVTGDALEVTRGRYHRSWDWIALAIERLRRSERKTKDFARFLFYRARAAMIALGRSVEGDAWLERHFELTKDAPAGLYHRLMTWGPRVRCLVEGGDVGVAFEQLVESFEAEKQNPRFSHPILAEYYVAVLHGRIHQCIRASATDRATLLPKLRRAVSDVRAATRMPLVKVHRVVGDAHVAWLEGDREKARSLLVAAASLAESESCPSALYSVARARAHMLREDGRLDAARDQGRIAEALAAANGAAHRARFVREELSLPQSGRPIRAGASTRFSASQRARRQLTAFLNIVGSPQPGADAVDLATKILDNLLTDLDAETAVLSFRTVTPYGLILARSRHGESWSDIDERRLGVLNGVRDARVTTPIASLVDGRTDPKRVLAIALFLYDESVGALYLERAPEFAPFSPDEHEVFELVSHQVPIALEMSRLLAERARIEVSLRHANKMEALGQLAGGVAHDFNNMLMVVRGSLDLIAARDELPADVNQELEVISQAATRAAELTRQLLGFSRHKPLSLVPVDVASVIQELDPMLQRVAGKRVRVGIRVGDVHLVRIDRAAFDQALVNLTLNARDAMPDGGTLTIAARSLSLDDATAESTGMKPGDYVVVEVADTGHGMDADVAARVFDPFFTTKANSGGTGLGLSMVYGFAKNSGGEVNVASEPGVGTTFRILLPRAVVKDVPPSAPVLEPAPPPKAHRDDHAILIVDDDRAVRDSLKRVLHRAGYRVFAASGANDALDIVRRCAPEISLVVLDVMMPGMSGPELARRFVEIKFPAPVLFISGFAPTELPSDLGTVKPGSLLQKPFGGAELLERVAALVHS